MILRLLGHSFEYETRNVAAIFFPGEKFQMTSEPGTAEEEIVIQIRENLCSAKISFGGQVWEKNCLVVQNDPEQTLCRTLYQVLSECTGYRPLWGMLTGVRPVNLIARAKTAGASDDEAVRFLRETYDVKEEKARLCLETYYGEQIVRRANDPDGYSLYISIPFCPSRCNYCSFVSQAIETAGRYMDQYVSCLEEELAYTACVMNRLGKKLQSVYIGGGTPTAVTAEHLRRITCAVRDHYSFDHLLEYTCEAGRPDTITEEKLRILKAAGVTRISINPQTMNDSVLKAIGRTHSAADFLRCYEMGRKIGFNAINTDLIAGLTGDTPDSFFRSVDEMIRLNPENVTIHALTVKRAADLAAVRDRSAIADGQTAAEMVEYGYRALKDAGYKPYYMYRQKNTVGNLENVGYTKPGHEGFYNVLIMSEIQPIIAVGAGASTKLVDGARMKRIFNYKYPMEYCREPDVFRKRKDEITEFFKKS